MKPRKEIHLTFLRMRKQKEKKKARLHPEEFQFSENQRELATEVGREQGSAKEVQGKKDFWKQRLTEDK